MRLSFAACISSAESWNHGQWRGPTISLSLCNKNLMINNALQESPTWGILMRYIIVHCTKYIWASCRWPIQNIYLLHFFFMFRNKHLINTYVPGTLTWNHAELHDKQLLNFYHIEAICMPLLNSARTNFLSSGIYISCSAHFMGLFWMFHWFSKKISYLKFSTIRNGPYVCGPLFYAPSITINQFFSHTPSLANESSVFQ